MTATSLRFIPRQHLQTGAGSYMTKPVEVFLNGNSLFTESDLSGQAVSAANVLNFFEDDDGATSQRESFTGSVDFIRIHDDTGTFGDVPNVPLPAALWLLLTAVGVVGCVRARVS
jgi:hypothetical protein